jgi:hypothetical protein
MRTTLRLAASGFAIVALLGGVLSAQMANGVDKAYMGTWKLNVAKSTYENATPPKDGTRIHEDRGNGFVLVIQDGVNSQGAKTHSEYVYKADGRDYPIAAPNQTGVQRIALKAVDAMTVTYQIKVDGKVVTDGKRTVSKDGRTMTLEQTGTNPQGQRVHTVALYDKQMIRATQ